MAARIAARIAAAVTFKDSKAARAPGSSSTGYSRLDRDEQNLPRGSTRTKLWICELK